MCVCAILLLSVSDFFRLLILQMRPKDAYVHYDPADFWNGELNENRAKPLSDEMWDDWSNEVKNSSEEYSKEFAKQQRLEV